MTVLQKNKKLAAGIGVAAAAAAVLAVGAGTYASFSDTESIPQTTFAAGNLDLQVGGTVTTDPLKFENFVPGDKATRTIVLTNAGSIAGNLSVKFTVNGTEGGCVEPETDVETTCDGGSELLEQLLVKVNGQDYGSLGTLGTNGIPTGGTLAAGAKQDFTIVVELPKGAKNDVMTDTAAVTAELTLVQP
jgi:predicted ribosomally synthesized peptide with SipW-like signal peptide